MKYSILILLSSLIPYTSSAKQSDSTNKGFGFALNSNFNTELDAIGLHPSALYYKGKSQIELGICLHPFVLKDQRTIGGEFNYKYFPNGVNKKYNLYLSVSCAYLNQYKKTYFPARYQYLFLSGGYGMQIKLFKRVYLGTGLNLGTFTKSKRSENPYKNRIGQKDLFDGFDMNLALQVNASFRF